MGDEFIQVVFGKTTGKSGETHRHRYTYRVYPSIWMTLHVGDTVVVPENWAFPMEQLATIVALNKGDYSGPTQRIAGVVDRFGIGQVVTDPTLTRHNREIHDEFRKRIERLEAVFLRQYRERKTEASF